LIELALRGGGPDNVTVVVADVVDHDYADQTQPILAGAVSGNDDSLAPPNTAAGRASAMAPRPPVAKAVVPEPDPLPTSQPRRRAFIAAALVTLLALAALPPAAVATTAAVVAAPVGLVEAARALGASKWQVIRDVVIPSALPETFTGIRLAVGMAYSSVVAAELFNGIPGIGGLVKDASNYNNTPVVLVGIFAIGISGLVIDGLLRTVERRAAPWRGKA